MVDLEFDPEKDEANILKHGVSLVRAVDLEIQSFEFDLRFTVETRFRAYGLLDGLPHSLAFTLSGLRIRAISLRRAHLDEYRRHVKD
jgi:uncharacterized DUF497 family protein